MLAHMSFQAETLILLALAVYVLQLFQRLQNNVVQTRTVSIQDDLYKMSRLTGSSEYEIFFISAEEWPAVTESMVNKHFKDYLLNQSTPFYVNAFVRKHQSQLDDLKLPPF